MNFSLWQDRVARALRRAEWELAARRQRPPALDTLLARASRDQFGGQEVVRRCAEPAYIEPEFGYVITAAGVMIEESLAPNME